MYRSTNSPVPVRCKGEKNKARQVSIEHTKPKHALLPLPSTLSLPRSTCPVLHTTRLQTWQDEVLAVVALVDILRLEALAVVEHRPVQAADRLRPLVQRSDALLIPIILDLDGSILLVNLAVDLLVDNQEAEDVLDLGHGDLERLSDEGQVEARVGRDELEDSLGAHVARDFVDVLCNERVREEVLVVVEHSLVLVDVVSLVGVDQVCHGSNTGVVLVRFRLLGFEWVDVGLHQHGGEDEVFEDLDSLQRTGLIVVAERFEEIALRILPVLLAHMHLPSTFSDNAHDLWMRNR